MKKTSILALAAFSLFGLSLFAEDEPVKDEPVATITETEETTTDSKVKISFNDEEEVSKENLFSCKDKEEKPTEDERTA